MKRIGLLLSLISLLYFSCERCHDPLQVYDLNVILNIYDQSTQRSIIGNTYRYDLVTILDMDSNPAPGLNIGQSGTIVFTLAPDFSKDSVNQRLEKKYLIRYDSTDTIDPIEMDTLTINYSFDVDEKNCDKIETLHFSIVFEDSVYTYPKIPSVAFLQKK